MERRRGPAGPATLVALAIGIVVAACGSVTPTSVGPASAPATQPPRSGIPSVAPTATADPAGVYAAIESQVQQLRGLAARSPVDPKLLDAATLRRNLAVAFARDNPPDTVLANQRLFELMGLLPVGSSLMDLYLRLLGSQVAGYYDPRTKELYVVSKSGAIGPTEQVTFAHEFTHALQDQNFGLQNLHIDTIGQGDASLADLAVAEGDATLLMSLWARAHLSPVELLQMVTEANDPGQAKVLAEMPEILKQTLFFPYLSGLQLVMAARAAGGWAAVDALYATPPASTEQVLHPDKLASREVPIKVSFPVDLANRLGSGWSTDIEDTLGEFQLRVWLEAAGRVPAETATAAAAGWGGDRVALVRDGDRLGAVLDTRWDSPGDAAEFAAAAQTTLDKLTIHHAMIAIDGTTRVTLFFASDEATINALAGALGLAG
jgi:hypothetical protein